MTPLERIQSLSRKDPEARSTAILREFLEALKVGTPFSLDQLYELDHERFTVAVRLLEQWRLGRFVHAYERQKLA